MANPFRTIRKTASVIGHILVSLLALGFLVGIGFLVADYVGEFGWGNFLLSILLFVGFFGVLFGIFALCSFIADKWKEWEQDYALKERKKAYDAGRPLLDPEPLVKWGMRLPYNYFGNTEVQGDFRPREYYSDVEADYMTANQKVAEGRV